MGDAISSSDTSHTIFDRLQLSSQLPKHLKVHVLSDVELAAKESFDCILQVTDGCSVDRAVAQLVNGTAAVLPSKPLLMEALRRMARAGQIQHMNTLANSIQTSYGEDQEVNEAMLYALVLKRDLISALNLCCSFQVVPQSLLGQEAICNLLLALLETKNLNQAESMFNYMLAISHGKTARKLFQCNAPPDKFVKIMMNAYNKSDLPERVFAVYRQIRNLAVEHDAEFHSLLITAASSRKEYASMAVALYQQMQALAFPKTPSNFASILMACSKGAGEHLLTAMQVWNEYIHHLPFRPDSRIVTTYLWNLASMEMRNTRRSVNPSVMYKNISTKDILNAVDELLHWWTVQNKQRLSSFMVSAVLAVYCNNLARARAEIFFWSAEHAEFITPFAHQAMLQMYDTMRDFAAARVVFEHYKKNFVGPHAPMVKLPYQAWRSLIRAAAIEGEFDTAIKYLLEMKNHQGYQPHMDDFRLLTMKFSEAGRKDLCQKLASICAAHHSNLSLQIPNDSWNRRSESLQNYLQSVYPRESSPKSRL